MAGHAYSVLDARRFSELSLVQLRNPWGTFEWKGAWSDGSPEWGKNPKIKKLIRPKDDDDGSFWMAWEDFSRIFASIDVCARSTGLRDLNLDAMESDGKCRSFLGPLLGCCAGCASFWLACRLPLTTALRIHLLSCTCPTKRLRDLVDAMRLLADPAGEYVKVRGKRIRGKLRVVWETAEASGCELAPPRPVVDWAHGGDIGVSRY